MTKTGLRLLQAIVLAVLFAGVGLINGRLFNVDINTHENQAASDSLIQVRKVFPEHKFIGSPATNSVIVKDKSGKKIAELLFTMPFCKDISGFGGAVPMVIVMNNEREIQQLILLPNSETPDWITSLEEAGFLDSWNGLTPSEVVTKKVDAVSGATFSSLAILKSVQLRASVYCNEVHKKDEINRKALFLNIAVFLVIIFALFHFLFPSKLRKVRWLLHLLNISVLGFLTVNFLSMAFLTNSFLNGIDVFQKAGLFVVLLVSLLLPLFTGKAFYCQYVCPFGSCQYFAGLILKKKFRYPARISKILSYSKYIYLMVILILLYAGVEVTLESLEPFSAFAYKFAAIPAFVLAGVFIILAVFLNKPWCRYFCPTGAVFELIRKPIVFKTEDSDEIGQDKNVTNRDEY